jgi:hypothetical protein
MQQQLLNMANSSQQNQQILDQMTALATTVLTLQTQLNNNNQDQGNCRGRGRGRDNDRRRCGGAGRGSNACDFKYCWSHGNFAHAGTNCESKANGHINDATYANMQGGSTTRCHWL